MNIIEIERAREIVAACTAHVYHAMGIPGTEPPPPIKNYTLRELLDAHETVAAQNKIHSSTPGTHTIQVVCDDRLVAALYVACHYPACEADKAEQIAQVGNSLVVVLEDPRATAAAREWWQS